MAVFLSLSDEEFHALVVVLGGYKEGLFEELRYRLSDDDDVTCLDAELRLVAGLEQKLKNAG